MMKAIMDFHAHLDHFVKIGYLEFAFSSHQFTSRSFNPVRIEI